MNYNAAIAAAWAARQAGQTPRPLAARVARAVRRARSSGARVPEGCALRRASGCLRVVQRRAQVGQTPRAAARRGACGAPGAI